METISRELYWLVLTTALTGILWIPYILQLIRELGLKGALWDPTGEHGLHAPWAQRSKRAHLNAVENLVVFAPLVLIAELLNATNSNTAIAATLFFWVRLTHALVYTAGLPVARTVIFLGGFGCQAIFVLSILSNF